MSMPIDMTEIFGTGQGGGAQALFNAFMPMKIDPSLFDPSRFGLPMMGLPMMGFSAGSFPMAGFAMPGFPVPGFGAGGGGQPEPFAFGPFFGLSPAAVPAFDAEAAAAFTAPALAMGKAYLAMSQSVMQAMMGLYVGGLEASRTAANQMVTAENPVEAMSGVALASLEDARHRVAAAQEQITEAVEAFTASTAATAVDMREQVTEASEQVKSFVAAAAMPVLFMTEDAPVEQSPLNTTGATEPVAVEAVAVEAAPVAVEAVAVEAAPVAVEAVAVEAAPVAVEAVAVPPVEAGEPTDADRPPGIVVPRGEGPDDLKMISGVGPKIEGILHGLGIYHFDQIAQWSAREVAWVDKYLKFSGRIVRDDWVAQADALATGGADEYRRRFGKDPR